MTPQWILWCWTAASLLGLLVSVYRSVRLWQEASWHRRQAEEQPSVGADTRYALSSGHLRRELTRLLVHTVAVTAGLVAVAVPFGHPARSIVVPALLLMQLITVGSTLGEWYQQSRLEHLVERQLREAEEGPFAEREPVR